MNNKPIILLKISGAALKDDNSIISSKKINNVVRQIIQIHKQYDISIVVGGGNIWRGNVAAENNMRRVPADYMGMLATTINSLALKEIFIANNSDATIYSLLSCPKISRDYVVENVKESLENHEIVIFAGGTGQPFFTTDTGAAIRAAEINAKMIIMGKDGVDGVYSDDPKINKSATRFEKLTYDEIIDKKLKVMDTTALTFCKDNNIEIVVFNMERENSIIKALNKEIPTTIISNKKEK